MKKYQLMCTDCVEKLPSTIEPFLVPGHVLILAIDGTLDVYHMADVNIPDGDPVAQYRLIED